MGIFSALNPFSGAIEKAADIVDKAVLDQDLKAQLNAELKAMEHKGNQLSLELEAKKIELEAALLQAKEETYKIALQTTTIPWVDATHKLSRPMLSFWIPTLNAVVVLLLAFYDKPIDGNILGILGGSNATAAIYSWVKGKGATPK